jgi:hypothetical protein
MQAAHLSSGDRWPAVLLRLQGPLHGCSRVHSRPLRLCPQLLQHRTQRHEGDLPRAPHLQRTANSAPACSYYRAL